MTQRLRARFDGRRAVVAGLVAGVALAGITSVVPVDARAAEPAKAERIVSIGGAVTEILYALGLSDRIVGVDSTSLYPPEALATKANVGYMRQLSPEGLLSLNPTRIVAVEGSGPAGTLDVLREAKVPLVMIPDRFTEDGIVAKIRVVAHTMDADARGECLASAVATDLTAMRALRDRIRDHRRVMFVMSLVDGRAMAAGRGTAADAIIALAGGVNAIDGFDGYKTIGEEAIVAAKPDVVLAMQRGRDSITAENVFASPAFMLTPAAKTKAFVTLDGLYLLGFGPRTASAAHDLAAALYPDVARADGVWTSHVAKADCRTP